MLIELLKWLRGWLRDLICGITRCAVPLAVLAAWFGLLFVPQGQDVLRRAVERAVLDQSYGDLVYLTLSSLILGLAIWYAARWLLLVPFPGLAMCGDPGISGQTKPAGLWRRNLPRLFGALVPAFVGVNYLWLRSLHADPKGAQVLGVKRETADPVLGWEFGLAIGFISLAVLLFLFLVLRARIFRLKGRKAGGVPLLLHAQDPLPATTVRVIIWAIMLTWLAAWIILMFPLSVGRVVGSAALGAFALAGITLFGSFLLTFMPLRRRLPNLVPVALLAAAVLSIRNEKPPSSMVEPATAWNPPKSVGAAYEEWRRKFPQNDSYYVVAAEGGGIRAAYWTAAVLEMLDQEIPAFPSKLFAISSVSGGSIGSGMWLAGLRARQCLNEKAQEGGRESQKKFATRALAADFLSPILGLWFYPDALSGFLPSPLPMAGRSRGLDEGLARAASRLAQKPLRMQLDQFYSAGGGLPYGLFNVTVAESGQRAILSALDTDDFTDVYVPQAKATLVGASGKAFDPSWRHQTVAALMHHSARFPFVSPPGPVLSMDEKYEPKVPLAKFLDGGYFDNSGIVTALEVIARMKKKECALSRKMSEDELGDNWEQKCVRVKNEKKIMLIVIANDEYEECGHAENSMICRRLAKPKPRPVVAGGAFLYEVLPLLSGVYHVRDSHVHDAMTRAVASMPNQVAEFSGGVAAPLGWALSRTMVERLDAAARGFKNKIPSLLTGSSNDAHALGEEVALDCHGGQSNKLAMEATK